MKKMFRVIDTEDFPEVNSFPNHRKVRYYVLFGKPVYLKVWIFTPAYGWVQTCSRWCCRDKWIHPEK